MNTYHTGVVLKVQEDTVESLPGLGLSDDDGGVDLLSQLGLSLLDGGHDHVTDTTGGETVQAGADALDRDDVQVSGARVVGAVHDGTAAEAVLVSFLPLLFGAHLGVLGAAGRACRRRGSRDVHRETQGHLKLATRGTTSVQNQSVAINSSWDLLCAAC